MSQEFPNNREHYHTLANEIEELVSKPNLSNGSVPRAVVAIVEMLRNGDMKSAQATFKWEGDKILSYPQIYDFLVRNLK